MVRTVTRYSAAAVVLVITGVVAAIIALAIVLILVGANQNNMIVDVIVTVADFLTTPFQGMFPQDSVRSDVLVNWGIALLVYLALGGIIARIVR
ncbi:MAG TPA: hypothetical protein VHI11_10840 [Jiangellaceae bacterium]|jgi:hypothetical protein|nr:hypothetical protein [Jiangellaceae bacterium]